MGFSVQVFFILRRHYARGKEMTGNERKVKLYPFSGTKHAHDIEFRRVRVKNELSEAVQFDGKRFVCKISDEEYAALENLEERLDDLIGYMHEGIVWLDGKRWELAQDCVLWAACMRGVR